VLTYLAVAGLIVLFALVQYVLQGDVEPLAVRGTFGNRNVLGGYLALSLPLALSFAVHSRSIAIRVWTGLVFAVGVSLVLAGGALLALVVAAATVALTAGTWPGRVALAGLLVLVVLVLPRLPRENLWTAHDSIAFYNPSGEPEMRYPEWQAAAAMTAANPLVGVGLGNYQANIGQYYGVLPSANVKAEPDTQNMYLVLASTVGVPAAFCFLALLLLAMVRAAKAGWTAERDGFERACTFGALAATLAFSISCIWSPLLVRGIGLPMAFILALCLQPPLHGEAPAGDAAS
jgi:O-antigen ligase